MQNAWFQHGDMILPVDEAHMSIRTGKRNMTILSNDTDKYNRAMSATLDMQNGDTIWAYSITISDSPFGRIIKSNEEYEIETT